MGIVVVLMFYAVALTIVATVGAVVLGLLASFLTRRSLLGRRRAIILSALFPYLCVGYVGAWFIGYAVVNYTVFHRDPGLGDTWETPLPNGYALMMIDVTDEGTVYNPKTQPEGGLVVGRGDSVFGVRQMQVVGARIFGARDTGYFGRIGQDSKFVDSYFELDTKKNAVIEFKSLDELSKRALGEGVRLQLREFQSVFSDYRTTWFDYAAGIALLALPAAGFVFLVRWVWLVRRSRVVAT